MLAFLCLFESDVPAGDYAELTIAVQRREELLDHMRDLATQAGAEFFVQRNPYWDDFGLDTEPEDEADWWQTGSAPPAYGEQPTPPEPSREKNHFLCIFELPSVRLAVQLGNRIKKTFGQNVLKMLIKSFKANPEYQCKPGARFDPTCGEQVASGKYPAGDVALQYSPYEDYEGNIIRWEQSKPWYEQ